jgi:hypothetical protein
MESELVKTLYALAAIFMFCGVLCTYAKAQHGIRTARMVTIIFLGVSAILCLTSLVLLV